MRDIEKENVIRDLQTQITELNEQKRSIVQPFDDQIKQLNEELSRIYKEESKERKQGQKVENLVRILAWYKSGDFNWDDRGYGSYIRSRNYQVEISIVPQNKQHNIYGTTPRAPQGPYKLGSLKGSIPWGGVIFRCPSKNLDGKTLEEAKQWALEEFENRLKKACKKYGIDYDG